jgi:hypothetical protein
LIIHEGFNKCYTGTFESLFLVTSRLASLSVPSIGILGSAIVAFLILFIIYLLVIGFVLWLAGEIVVGRRVTFGEALGIAGVGTFLIGASLSLLGLVLGGLLGLVIFLLLVKHYFKTGWLGAVGVGIMTIIVGVVIAFILTTLALGALVFLPHIPGL